VKITESGLASRALNPDLDEIWSRWRTSSGILEVSLCIACGNSLPLHIIVSQEREIRAFQWQCSGMCVLCARSMAGIKKGGVFLILMS
jgi:hypothetical protein